MTQATRYDGLDAVRAGAMLLGLAFHAAWAYVPGIGEWYVVGDAANDAFFVTLVGVLHAFRMQLFFALSGFFSHLVFERRGADGFLRERARRLLVPFAVALPLVLVADVAVRSWSASRGLLSLAYAVGTAPRWGPLHLWFLEYLFVFCLAAWVLARVGVTGAALSRGLAKVLRAPELLLVLGVPTGLALVAHPKFEPDASFVPDLATAFHYAPFYALGWLLWPARDAVTTLARRAWWMAVAGLGVAVWLFSRPLQWQPEGQFLAGIVGWAMTLGLLGVAFRVPAGTRPVLRFLVDASYWVYLVHYPLVLALHVAFATVPLPVFVKYVLVLSLVFGLALGTFVLFVRRSGLGPWLGVRLRTTAE